MTIMGLSYVVEEMGMIFPIPFALEMDNDAARIFCLGSAHKTKLKHVDCRQEWVRTLRNRDITTPVHIDSELNDAELPIYSRGGRIGPLKRAFFEAHLRLGFGFFSLF